MMPSANVLEHPKAMSNQVKNRSLQPWVVCFSAALFFFFEFMQVNMFNALDPSLIKAFHVNATELGSLSANYFYANFLFLFPAGMLLDRYSTRWIIILAMGASVLCTFGFAMSEHVWQAGACRFITGIGGSFCLLANVRLASRWFPPRRMALVVGLIVTFAMLGGTVAQTPMILLTDSIGWRNTLLVDAFSGVAILIVIALFVRDYPQGMAAKVDAHYQQLKDTGFWKALGQTVRNGQNWLCGLYTSFLNLPILLLGAMWGSMYLVQVRGLTRPESSAVTSALFIGMIIGSPFIGWLSDKLQRRKSPMIIGAVLSVLLFIGLILTPDLSLFELIGLFFLLGFITSAQIISYPLIAESNPAALTGSSEGLASMLIMAGGVSPNLCLLGLWKCTGIIRLRTVYPYMQRVIIKLLCG